MLKSHLSIKKDDNEEEETKPVEEEEETKPVQDEQEAEEGVLPVVEEYIKHLKRSEVSIRLSLLGRTAAGDGFAYLKATITDLGLTHIDAITTFQHLQFLDVSSNKMQLDRLQIVTKLPFLILLQADKNELNSAGLHKMNYLQIIIMNHNQIETVEDVYQPVLSTLELGFNKIKAIEFKTKMPNMRCLDFRNNQITSIVGLDFPKLDSLYLANNRITSLVGLESLVNLRILHVRHNPIRLLDGFHADQTKLMYINLRHCKIATSRQVKKLRVLKGLETLVLRGCPYMGGTGEDDAETSDAEDDPEIRLDILATLPRLKRLNKGAVTPEERTEAKVLMMQRLEEGEKDEEEIEHEEHLLEGEEVEEI